MPSDAALLEKRDISYSEELATLQENHQFEYSMAVLATQERDRLAEREYNRKTQKTALIFLSCICFFLVVAIIAAFHFGKDQLLLDCAKYLAIGGGGCGAGYVWGFRRGKRAG